MDLDKQQIEAVNLCNDTKKRLVSVTGSAGTGKTTTIRIVYENLVEAGYKVALCAPTGKAAKRIFDATGIEATTIHRRLEYSMPGDVNEKTGEAAIPGMPKRNRFYRLECDILLVDEYSMVNQETHRAIIDALPHGGCLRCFGDLNQLAPIENTEAMRRLPSAFKTVLKKHPSVQLTTIHRQAEGSGIIRNAALILNKRIPPPLDDFAVRITDHPVETLMTAIKASHELDDGFNSIHCQVITPIKRSYTGVYNINKTLQKHYQGTNNGLEMPRQNWDLKNKESKYNLIEGDKVIFTANLYDLEVFNGETGIVKEITTFEEIIVDLGDRVITVPPVLTVHSRYKGMVDIDPRKSIDLAYAVTTHKCQGNEFQRVIYVINKACGKLLGRGNLYTGITRARKHVTLIADNRSLGLSLFRD